MSAQFEILLIAVMTAAACALPGTFLVLRRMAMMADSISHTILLGIVFAFFATGDLSSPLLILGAAAMGVATVFLTETLGRTRLMAEDAAIGVVFPLIFSAAIILISRYAGSAHLDNDSVLLGELAFAPFDRLRIAGIDIGASTAYVSGILLMINLAAILLFNKELKLATFDPILAGLVGFSPVLLHYGLMTMVSVTAVGSFRAVGSILTVAFMIGPPATAYLLTDHLGRMLALGAGIGALNGLLGYFVAVIFDVSIAGCMAVSTGVIFFAVLIFAPKRGLVASLLRKRRRGLEFNRAVLLFFLADEGGTVSLTMISRRLGWSDEQTARLSRTLETGGLLVHTQNGVLLTPKGHESCAELNQSLFG